MCPPGEHQERSLECIFRVLHMAEHAATHSEDHRPMPAHEDRERRVVARGNETANEIAVGCEFARLADESSDGAGEPLANHPVPSGCRSIIPCQRGKGRVHFFRRSAFSFRDRLT